MKNKLWLVFILITVVTWGVWGAFSGYQIQNGIPDTVVYIIWATIAHGIIDSAQMI